MIVRLHDSFVVKTITKLRNRRMKKIVVEEPRELQVGNVPIVAECMKTTRSDISLE